MRLQFWGPFCPWERHEGELSDYTAGLKALSFKMLLWLNYCWNKMGVIGSQYKMPGFPAEHMLILSVIYKCCCFTKCLLAQGSGLLRLGSRCPFLAHLNCVGKSIESALNVSSDMRQRAGARCRPGALVVAELFRESACKFQANSGQEHFK